MSVVGRATPSTVSDVLQQLTPTSNPRDYLRVAGNKDLIRFLDKDSTCSWRLRAW